MELKKIGFVAKRHITKELEHFKETKYLSHLVTAPSTYFFFQAEDGIRDVAVTGVQTCALPIFDGMTEKGYYYSANKFFSPEHGGTHMDAPIHFAKNGKTVDQIPLDQLIGQAL